MLSTELPGDPHIGDKHKRQDTCSIDKKKDQRHFSRPQPATFRHSLTNSTINTQDGPLRMFARQMILQTIIPSQPNSDYPLMTAAKPASKENAIIDPVLVNQTVSAAPTLGT